MIRCQTSTCFSSARPAQQQALVRRFFLALSVVCVLGAVFKQHLDDGYGNDDIWTTTAKFVHEDEMNRSSSHGANLRAALDGSDELSRSARSEVGDSWILRNFVVDGGVL